MSGVSWRAKNSGASGLFDSKFHNALYGDAKGWARWFFPYLYSFIPGVMNPHAKVIQCWKQFFVIFCMVAIFIDPLCFFVFGVQKENRCIVLSMPWTTTIVVLRSVIDFIYFLNMLLQFRLAYVAPESRVVGSGDLVDHPKKIALHYLHGYFLIDIFVILPLPQIMILLVGINYVGSLGNYARQLLWASVFLQYVPRVIRFHSMLTLWSTGGIIFETALANYVILLLPIVLAGHVVGSCWYLLGLQRVYQCLRVICNVSTLKFCNKFINCGYGDIEEFRVLAEWESWQKDEDVITCFDEDGPFNYGIYSQVLNIATEPHIFIRYLYSIFWGFQQMSTLAGNQVPSTFVWEILFTMGIIGLGLFLFTMVLGNLQNFHRGRGQRRFEMKLRRDDVEQWISHWRLPEELKRQVRQLEKVNWDATQGVNEELLLENLPEDLQREIRRHLFKFIKKVHIFSQMDDPILDAICERLRRKMYIKGSRILCFGGPVEKMVFILRGKMESIGEDCNIVQLSEGDVCGDELLTWSLEHSVNKGQKIRTSGQWLLSKRMVRCLTTVEAFSLRAADLEEVIIHFARFLQNPRIQGAMRYESPYWREVAATRIQVAWKYRKKRFSREIQQPYTLDDDDDDDDSLLKKLESAHKKQKAYGSGKQKAYRLGKRKLKKDVPIDAKEIPSHLNAMPQPQVAATFVPRQDNDSVALALQILEEMDDVSSDSDLYIEAMQVLEDPVKREFFLKMIPSMRSRWLQSVISKEQGPSV